MNQKNRKAEKFSRQLIIGLLTFLFTMVIVLQFKTTMHSKANTSSNSKDNVEQLKSNLEIATNENIKLKEEVARLTNEYKIKINALGDEGVESDIKTLSKELERVNMIACLSDVQGEGIIIKMSDIENPDLDIVSPTSTIIHNKDIFETVNELRKAGAQAIAINGERILPMSELLCTGTTITVNGSKLIYPFVITAIGDSERLYTELNNSYIISYLISHGFDMNISKEKDLTINKYSGNVNKLIDRLEGVDSNEKGI